MKWVIPPKPTQEVKQSLQSFGRIEQQILSNRGYLTESSANAFLISDIALDADPLLINDMKEAVERVFLAVETDQLICIYGDYDADGVTATALCSEALREIGANVEIYFPDRFGEGYGLNRNAVERIAAMNSNLLITVDCGVRAVTEISLANSLGLDVIVTDHHLQGDVLPDALAVLNPHRVDTTYPNDGLAGVGVAYKLAQALYRTKGLPVSAEKALLDFVALGTIADMVPLRGENRTLVKMGLELINSSPRPGLKELIKVSGYREGSIDSTAVGFGLGPRINAAGRVKSALPAYKLLIEQNPQAANTLALELDQLNSERKQLTLDVVNRAIEIFMLRDQSNVLVVAEKDFHEGVVGLAASRISDTYYRPAVVGKVGDTFTRASARSIPGFHITAALEQCADLLERFGGHEAAAGFSVLNTNFQALQNRLESIASEILGDDDLLPALEIDSDADFKDLDESIMRFIDQLQPCGQGNAWPIFYTENVQVMGCRAVGADKTHLKLTLKKSSKPFDAIAFRMGNMIDQLPDSIDIAYRLERNNYLGYDSLQLNIVDIHFSGSEDHTRGKAN